MIVRGLLSALLFAAIVWSSDPRAPFDRLKAEARNATRAKDWATAEACYLKLLDLAPAVHASTLETYAEIVSPLAEIYKRTDEADKLEKLYQRRVTDSGEGLGHGMAQADLGFFYQGSDFSSADLFRGEQLVDAAV